MTTRPDAWLTALLAMGTFQIAGLSLLLVRKGVPGAAIRQAIRPLFAVWVLLWPLYGHPAWLAAGMAVLMLPLLLAAYGRGPVGRSLCLAWADAVPQRDRRCLPVPMIAFVAALGIAATWFASMPALGFGLGLAACLAIPGAETMDRLRLGVLGLRSHPAQTIAGHALFVLMAAAAMAWSLHVHDHLGFQTTGMHAIMGAAIAAAARALIPGDWNQPAAVLTMGGVLWML